VIIPNSRTKYKTDERFLGRVKREGNPEKSSKPEAGERGGIWALRKKA